MKNSKEKVRKRNDKFEGEKECLLFADIGKGDGHQVEGDGAHMGPLAKLSSLLVFIPFIVYIEVNQSMVIIIYCPLKSF